MGKTGQEAFFGIGTKWHPERQRWISPTSGLNTIENDQGVIWRYMPQLENGSDPEKAVAAFVITYFLKKYGRRVSETFMVRKGDLPVFEASQEYDAWGIPIKTRYIPQGEVSFEYVEETKEYTIMSLLGGFPQTMVDTILTAPVTLSNLIRQGAKEIQETGTSKIAEVLIEKDPSLRAQFYADGKEMADIAGKESPGLVTKKTGKTIVLAGSLILGLIALIR